MFDKNAFSCFLDVASPTCRKKKENNIEAWLHLVFEYQYSNKKSLNKLYIFWLIWEGINGFRQQVTFLKWNHNMTENITANNGSNSGQIGQT